MLYHKEKHTPLILPEYVDKNRINTFFNEQTVNYITFKDNARYLLENNIVNYQQVAGIFYE